MHRLLRLITHIDVFFVGVHCLLPKLERRELERGDRRKGEAQADLATTHTFGQYDFEVLSTLSRAENTQAVITAWKMRQRPNAFEKMRLSLT